MRGFFIPRGRLKSKMSTMTDNQAQTANHARGIILMLLSVLGFTANTLLIRGLAEHHAIDAWLIATVRFIVGLVVVTAVYAPGGKLRPANLITNRKLILRGVIGAIGVYTYYLTIARIGAGRATFIGNTHILMASLLAVVVLREKFTGRLLIGSAGGLLGLSLLTNLIGASGPSISVWDLVALGGAASSAVVVVTIRQLHGSEHTSTIFAALCFYGLLFCLVPTLFRYQQPPLGAWPWLLASGLCVSFAQLAMTQAYRDLPVGQGSQLQILVPPGTALGGWLLFSEMFSGQELLGAVLILASTVFIMIKR